MNKMKTISVDKVTLNVGAGKDQNNLKKGIILLKELTGIEPLQTKSKKRIPNWGLRLGLPIGCKITLRGIQAEEMIIKLLKAKDNILKDTQFDSSGNVSFGIHEYIDVPGVKYLPEIGIIGFEAAITLKRPGYRIKLRKLKTKKVGKKHQITKEDAIKFMQEKFNIKLGEQ